MTIKKKLVISYDIKDIIDTINYLYPGKGTLDNPFPIDNFVKNDLKGLSKVNFGEHIIIELDSGPLNEVDPQFCYCKIQNITKGSKNLVNKKDWSQYYHFEKNSDKEIVAPNGYLFIKPKNNQINIVTAKPETSRLINLSFVYFAYTLVLYFIYNKERYYFKLDPIAKISSRH